MTLLIVSPDFASHVLPLLALARAWSSHGERVVVATGPAVGPYVERAGYERLDLVLGRGSNPGVARPADQPPGEDDNLRNFFEATRRGMTETLRFQAERRRGDLLWDPETTALATIDAAVAIGPDTILVDHLAFGATLGLQAAGIPYADVVLGHPTALPVGSERYGVPPAWPAAFDPDPAELAGLERLADDVANRFTDDWNRALRSLDPGAPAVADAFRVRGTSVLYSYPGELHDPDRTGLLPDGAEFLGSAAREEQLDGDAGDWLAHDPGRPLAVVSFGSFLSARSDVLARVAGALASSELRVALATGAVDPAELGPLPGNWFVRRFLPQVALVRHAAVAITHAGNNGVTEALAHGVPLLVLPFSTDQFAVAADLERTGLGVALDPNRATEAEIRSAVLSLLAGPQRAAAAGLGARLAADPGPARARRSVTAALTPSVRFHLASGESFR